MYHEQQTRMLCGIHATNNFLQRKVYTKEMFDEIATRLFLESPEKDMYRFNPHKYKFFGNYDINVVMEALRLEGFNTEWFPKTDPEKSLTALFWEDDVRGIIINTPTSMGRHWTCLRKGSHRGESAVYHDSKCTKAIIFRINDEVNRFIQRIMTQNDTNEFFIIRTIHN